MASQGEETERAKAPLILVEPETAFWLAGSILGLMQSSVICVVSLQSPADLEIDPIKAAMTQLVPHARLMPPDSEASLEENLLQCVHAWQAAVQRDRSVPVFGPCSISRMNGGAEGATKVRFRFAVPSDHLEATRMALAWTIMAVNRLAAGVGNLDGTLSELGNSLAAMQNSLMPYAMKGTNGFRFMEAAMELGIPYHTVVHDMIAYGQGKNSIRLFSTISEHTTWMGGIFSKDKYLTAQVLRRFGLPAPNHRLVSDEEAAVEAAAALGYPVVVKPTDQEQGVGVFPSIRTEEALRARYADARKISKLILVEQHVAGEDFRITVMNGEVIKIMRRRPGGVTGDGKRSVALLLEDVRKASEKESGRSWKNRVSLKLDDEALAILHEDGCSPDTIPEEGVFVPLRRKANVSAGGFHELIPFDQVHSDNLRMAVRVAEILQLDFAGVDLLIPDISKSWRESHAIICEVNAQPQIGYRDTPEIFKEILRKLMPGKATIPLHLIILENEKVPKFNAARMAAKLGCNGLAFRNRSWIDGFGWSRPFDNDLAAARSLLIDKSLTGALIVTSDEELKRHGLASAHFDTIKILLESADTSQALSGLIRLTYDLVTPHSRHVQIVRPPA
ncbi:acetate--CoA ligase family protein [Tsuneonella sp. CC-YZS046]|uniref:acetate--CoA ligase family protein n=1 Tax=Tsuneonella sp. CC-YZS046 TaxID=3042152 RepID=UPI002D7722D4|nr:acetate--CoA ligase family protein [Tsuneonella sp. CC-YZS046]WRO67590.1 acetate--CoA ligase family protein [Tsuneonella sp. CC-YZS046]